MYKYIARGLYKKALLLKALSYYRIDGIDRVLVEGVGREVSLPALFDPWSTRSIKLGFSISIEDTGFTEAWLIIDANVDGLVYVDGELVQGYDRAHKSVLLDPGEHSVSIVFSNKGFLSMVPERIVINSIKVAYLMPYTYKLGLYTQILSELALNLLDKGYDEPAVDLIGLLKNVLNKVVYWPTSPLQARVYVELLSEDKLLQETTPLYNELYWMSIREEEKLVGVGYKEPDYRRVEEESRRLLGELLRGLDMLCEKHGKQGVLYAIGYSHLDTAWLWGYSEAREKLVRTVANVLAVHKRYPEMKFLQSSSLYYKWLCSMDDRLCREVGEAISSGWWVLGGGMVVETDTLLPLGETLVRQLLYGQKYLEEKYGRIAEFAWLPDSFGFPASLPQILLKAGVKAFFTHKLEWNRFNRFPYTIFYWRGIDGSRIIAHTIRLTYSVKPTPSSLLELWRRHTEKTVYPGLLMVYGYGDGGGGPNHEMLEKIRILSRAPIVPVIKHASPVDYVRDLLSSTMGRSIPEWSGELSVEIHRGVYTSNTKVKKLVREVEHLIRTLEILSTIHWLYHGAEYPVDTIKELWEPLLKACFHDVVTGTSTHRAVEEAFNELARVVNVLEKLIREKISVLAPGNTITLFNPTQWRRREVVEVPWTRSFESKSIVQLLPSGRMLVQVDVQGFSLSTLNSCLVRGDDVDPVEARVGDNGYVVENSFYRLVVGFNGTITSLYDKSSGRELLRAPSNIVKVYTDIPDLWDAWDVSEDYKDWLVGEIKFSKHVIMEKGPLRTVLRFTGEYRNSHVVLDIIGYAGSPRIDLVYTLDWRERNVLVKTWFYPNINTSKASYSIPYGVYERPTTRNTSWEKALYEVPLHGWVSLCDGGECFTILSRVPRGVSVEGSHVGVSLIKTSMQPNPIADSGRIQVGLSILIHRDLVDAVKEFYKIIHPLITSIPGENPLEWGREKTVDKQFFRVEPGNIVVEAIKVSEDGEDLVIRVYETLNKYTRARICLEKPVIKSCSTVDLLEKPFEDKVTCNRECVEFHMKPYEIKTLRIEVERTS